MGLEEETAITARHLKQKLVSIMIPTLITAGVRLHTKRRNTSLMKRVIRRMTVTAPLIAIDMRVTIIHHDMELKKLNVSID